MLRWLKSWNLLISITRVQRDLEIHSIVFHLVTNDRFSLTHVRSRADATKFLPQRKSSEVYVPKLHVCFC